ncbi:phosphatidate cytidylyltransferase [Pseudochelatococcus lubricantis]|uniref:phosphatidate cytidylyltransferase n=1 Tax=Pseudochelatococcus lubricantis TaxID=1538102 RepID=UPI0035EF09B1
MSNPRMPGAPSSDPSGAGPAGKARSELSARVASALVLAAIAIAATWWGGLPFAALWALAAGVVVFEWLGLVGSRVADTEGSLPAAGALPLVLRLLAAMLTGLLPLFAALGFHRAVIAGAAAALVTAAVWGLAAGRGARGVERVIPALAGVACGALIGLTPVLVRAVSGVGAAAIAWMFAVTWTTDIAAYFSGRAIGGPRLWPRVSPNKTWAGCIGGTLAGTFMGWLVASLAQGAGVAVPWSALAVAGASAFASLAGQAGDLAESAFKRRAGVKDSSGLIPGHGGFMDRLDGFAAVCLLVAIALAAGAFATN